MKRIAQECSDEGGFEFENAMKLILGDFSDRSEKAQVILVVTWCVFFVNVHSFFQCFMSCFFKKEGFVGEDGAPDIEFIVNALANSVSFEREKLHKIIEKCATLPSKDQCDAAYKVRMMQKYMGMFINHFFYSSLSAIQTRSKI